MFLINQFGLGGDALYLVKILALLCGLLLFLRIVQPRRRWLRRSRR